METTAALIQTVLDIFVGTDARDWARVTRTFAPQVWLDYSSISGQPAATLAPAQLVAQWQQVLPGFAHTHHQLGNFEVKGVSENEATVSCYGTATHYLPQPTGSSVWAVVGTYDFHLVRQRETWRADRMTFHFKYQDGNLELPRLAAERVKNGQAAIR